MSGEDFNYYFGETETEDLPISPRCAGCPALFDAARTYDEAGKHLKHAKEAGGILLDGIPAEVLDQIGEMIDREAPLESREELKRGASAMIKVSEENSRREAAEHIDQLEDFVFMMQRVTADMQSSCSGAITLRAVKNNIDYRATVCSSLTANPSSDKARVTRWKA